MFNDAGLTGAALDDGKQARGGVVCALLARALEGARRAGPLGQSPRPVAKSPAVMQAAELLAADPSLSSAQLGKTLRLSASRTARLFKSEMGVSLPEYRNRLRLERFARLLEQGQGNLLELALEAGFGSYAQFYRAFLSLRGTTPRKFLRERGPRQ
jgi:transcriptional regulator GlxA family with amidase domain